MRRAVYAGSFDVFTNGHLRMIEEGARLFDELIVVVAVNPAKKRLFSLEASQEMILASTAHLENVSICVLPKDQYLVHFAKEFGVQFILRGLRAQSDFQYERNVQMTNRRIEPSVQTIFILTPPEFSDVSSSWVKGLIGPKGWEDVVEQFVPTAVLEELKRKFNE